MASDADLDFESFARQVTPMLLRTGWLLTGSQHGAEDLVQETLVRVYSRWSSRATVLNPEAYARTILVNEFLKGRRKRRFEVSVDLSEGQHAAGRDEVSSQTNSIVLQRALAGLEPKDRAVLVLRYFADQSVAEVARHLGVSEGAVRTRASRALTKLRVSLGDEFLPAAR